MRVLLVKEGREKVVVKISGKILTPDNIELVKSYANILKELWEKGILKAVVVGGGSLSRTFIKAAKELGTSKSMQDILGLEASRLNARLLISGLEPYAYPEPPRSIHEVLIASSSGKLVICGGLQPAQSTATVAAIIAELLGANKLVLASAVNGVYSADPRHNPGARLLRRITYSELSKVLSTSLEPGRYELLDPYAVSILRRSKIKTHVVNGFKPENVVKAALGDTSIGTIIYEP